jgi:hypothetical protein
MEPHSLKSRLLHWVRKLTGKPSGSTPQDCEFEARRIQKECPFYEIDLLALAAESKALRIHSDLLFGDLAIAARSALCSSGETRACMSILRRLAAATLGLPILVLIKNLCVLQK